MKYQIQGGEVARIIIKTALQLTQRNTILQDILLSYNFIPIVCNLSLKQKLRYFNCAETIFWDRSHITQSKRGEGGA